MLRQVHDVAFALVSRWPPSTLCTRLLVNRGRRACVRPVGFDHTIYLFGLSVEFQPALYLFGRSCGIWTYARLV